MHIASWNTKQFNVDLLINHRAPGHETLLGISNVDVKIWLFRSKNTFVCRYNFVFHINKIFCLNWVPGCLLVSLICYKSYFVPIFAFSKMSALFFSGALLWKTSTCHQKVSPKVIVWDFFSVVLGPLGSKNPKSLITSEFFPQFGPILLAYIVKHRLGSWP